jgi:hypothetical protein
VYSWNLVFVSEVFAEVIMTRALWPWDDDDDDGDDYGPH